MKAFVLQNAAMIFMGSGGICVAHDMLLPAATAYAIGLFFMEWWRKV